MKLEAPVDQATDTINSILSDTHSAIMTETKSVDAALKETTQNVQDQGILDE